MPLQRFSTPAIGAVLLALLIGVAGCGKGPALYPVHGQVTLADGTPVDLCRVIFHPSDGNRSATAISDSQGNYRAGTFRAGDGACIGTYRVTVVELQSADLDAAPRKRFDQRFSDLDSSGLQTTVESGENVFDIRLEPTSKR